MDGTEDRDASTMRPRQPGEGWTAEEVEAEIAEAIEEANAGKVTPLAAAWRSLIPE